MGASARWKRMRAKSFQAVEAKPERAGTPVPLTITTEPPKATSSTSAPSSLPPRPATASAASAASAGRRGWRKAASKLSLDKVADAAASPAKTPRFLATVRTASKRFAAGTPRMRRMMARARSSSVASDGTAPAPVSLASTARAHSVTASTPSWQRRMLAETSTASLGSAGTRSVDSRDGVEESKGSTERASMSRGSARLSATLGSSVEDQLLRTSVTGDVSQLLSAPSRRSRRHSRGSFSSAMLRVSTRERSFESRLLRGRHSMSNFHDLSPKLGGDRRPHVFSAELRSDGAGDVRPVVLKVRYADTLQSRRLLSEGVQTEAELLSRLKPPPTLRRLLLQFEDEAPELVDVLPAGERGVALSEDGRAEIVVLERLPTTLEEVMASASTSSTGARLPFRQLLGFAQDLLAAMRFLAGHGVVHRNLGLSKLLQREDGSLAISSLTHAVQLDPTLMQLELPVGKKTFAKEDHTAPEVLSTLYYFRNNPSPFMSLCYSGQPAWVTGVLLCEMMLGTHPLKGYPKAYYRNSELSYKLSDIATLPSDYPEVFRSAVRNLLHPDSARRWSLAQLGKVLDHLDEAESSITMAATLRRSASGAGPPTVGAPAPSMPYLTSPPSITSPGLSRRVREHASRLGLRISDDADDSKLASMSPEPELHLRSGRHFDFAFVDMEEDLTAVQYMGIEELVPYLLNYMLNEGRVTAATKALVRWCKDEDGVHAVMRHSGAAAILDAMRAFPVNRVIQQQCCASLQVIARHPDYVMTLYKLGSIAVLVDSLFHYSDEVDVAWRAMSAMGNMCATRLECRVAAGRRGALPFVAKAMRRNPSAKAVQKSAVYLLGAMAQGIDINREAIVKQGMLPLIVQALPRFEDDVQLLMLTCSATSALCSWTHRRHAAALASEGIVQELLHGMARFLEHPQAQRQCCAALAALAMFDKEVAEEEVRCGAVHAIYYDLVAFSSDANVVMACIWACSNIAEQSSRGAAAIIKVNMLSVVLESMWENPLRSDLQLASCKLLAMLSRSRPSLAARLGRSNAVPRVLEAIRDFPSNDALRIWGVRVLLSLALQVDHNKVELERHSALPLLVDGLRSVRNATVAALTLQLLLVLCTFDAKNRTVTRELGADVLLARISDRFPDVDSIAEDSEKLQLQLKEDALFHKRRGGGKKWEMKQRITQMFGELQTRMEAMERSGLLPRLSGGPTPPPGASLLGSALLDSIFPAGSSDALADGEEKKEDEDMPIA
eukprot:PLAT3617.3.p1 GENE.PLAT3617.3~~PLAT3617.3.p1  ORF type:complete len:1274 (+),score=565.96 PLAT3617.3:115-3822(+)